MRNDLTHTHIATVQTNPLDNFQSTSDTITQMRMLVEESLGNPYVMQACHDIYVGVNKALPTELDLIRASYWYVKHYLHFVQDEQIMVDDMGYTYHDIAYDGGKDLLISPVVILAQGKGNAYGDCDDFSMLLATLLICLGVRNVYFCTIAADKQEPDYFSHVYVKVVLLDGTVMPLDASHGPYPGWQTNRIYKSMDWLVGNASDTPSTPIPIQQQEVQQEPITPIVNGMINSAGAISTATSTSSWLTSILGI